MSETMRELLEWLDRGGGIGPDVHKRIRAVLDGRSASATFEAGDVVRVKAQGTANHGLPMTIENVLGYLPGVGAGVCCVWFDEHGQLHRGAFHPSELEHTSDRLVDGKVCATRG